MNELFTYSDKIPLVSIFCATYNQEKYISQAIEGFLMQKTNFLFEIIICEDKSTDETAKIIKEFEKKYPEMFVTFYHNENLYSKGIDFFLTEAFPIAKGKYIAMCEGDDYWTDPYKLQKQVDFLEKNDEFSFCCHRYNVFSVFKNKFEDLTYPLKFSPIIPFYKGVIITDKEYHDNWMTQILTTVFRKDAYLKVIKKSTEYKNFRDTHIFYYLLKQGNGICLDFNGGVYRQNEGGVYSGKTLSKRQIIDFLLFEELYIKTKDIRFLKHYSSLAIHLIIKGQYLKIVFKSIFLTLSIMDKINMMRIRYKN